MPDPSEPITSPSPESAVRPEPDAATSSDFTAASSHRSGILASLTRLGTAVGSLLGHAAIPEMAAALAYRTIFSLIPILLIAFLTLRLFKDTNSLVEQMLSRLMDQAGLTNLAGSGDGGFNLQQWISQRVQEFSGINFTWIGLISAGVLIYGAMGLLVAMEGSFNSVYGGQPARSWSKRVLQYWMILTLGPMLVYASFFASNLFINLATTVSEEAGGAGATFRVFLAYVSAVPISAMLLLALYLTIPNTRVAIRPAIVGAIVGGVLLELAKNGFAIYVQVAGVRSLYGSLALLPLFLFWVYITWIIVLFGLRLAFLIQHHRLSLIGQAWRGVMRRHLQAPLIGAMPEQTNVPLLLDRSVGLAILAHIADGFQQGRGGITAEQLEARAGVPISAVRVVLAALLERSLIVRIPNGDNKASKYSLARPASSIAAITAIESLDEAIISARGCGRVDAVLRTAEQAMSRSLGTMTLAEIIDNPPPPKSRATQSDAPPVPA
jgi:membrane protein